jgi:regulator of cell morphogenesis and NO signaling
MAVPSTPGETLGEPMNSTSDQTLGDLVTRTPAAARVFERAGIDYCCRGHRTLAEAAEAAGLDAASLAEEIDVLDGTTDEEWPSLPPAALADHIVATHHAYLREELPLLATLAVKVERAHGARHPELANVRALVEVLRADLEPHLDEEERVLFPAIRALAAAGPQELAAGAVAEPIATMGVEHERVAEIFESLRRASDDYAIPADACASYRSLYERLPAVERDTHVHIHKENHALFPAALRLSDTDAAAAASSR